MTNIKILLSAIIFLTSATSALAEWTTSHKVSIIDSLTAGNESFITLSGYQNVNCDENRIHLKTTNTQNYSEMISLVVSAFHANTDVKFLINSVCQADRVMLVK